MAAFFLGAAFFDATAVPALVVVFFGEAFGAAFWAAKVLVAVALVAGALAAALGADLVVALAGVLLLVLLLDEVFDFLLAPKTLDQPSAYLLLVPTRVIVTVSFSWIKPKLSSRRTNHRDLSMSRQYRYRSKFNTQMCEFDLLSISSFAVNP